MFFEDEEENKGTAGDAGTTDAPATDDTAAPADTL